MGWFIYELSPASITSWVELQEEFIHKFRGPNEDDDVSEDDVDSDDDDSFME
jgi:hypothetical protein